MTQGNKLQGVKMFNRSNIMKRAWQIIREAYTIAGNFCAPASYAKALSYALTLAWREVKKAPQIAALPIMEKEKEIARVNSKIESLNYKPLGHRIQRERKVLQTRLQELAA